MQLLSHSRAAAWPATLEWQQQWEAAVQDTGSRFNLAGGISRTSFRSLTLDNAQLSPVSGTSPVSRQLCPHCSQAPCGSRALEEEEEEDFAGWDLIHTKLSMQQEHALGGSQEGRHSWRVTSALTRGKETKQS